MDWGAPAYLWLLLLALPAAALAARDARRRRSDLADLVGSGVSGESWCSGRRSRGTRQFALGAACLLMALSLGQPRWGTLAEESESRGVDILIALDCSRSMLVNDLAPSRLAAAKEAVAALAARLQGDRIGLIAFAGSAFLVCPLSNDYGVFGAALSEAGTATIPLGGTSLEGALNEARRAYSEGSGGARVLILVSDGEDHGEDCSRAAQRLRESGVTVYTVAAGTGPGGLIPLPQGAFFRDREGNVVKSSLQPAALRQIAGAGGGRLLDLSAGRTVLAEVYAGELRNLPGKDFRSTRQRLREWFQVPLALALALLALEPFLDSRRKS